jgi:pimeloyl-ACP methyl ester carboxylesterase
MRFDSNETEYRLHDGRKLVVSSWYGSDPTSDWVVYLPGSAAALHRATSSERLAVVGRDFSRRTHYLAINKPGLRLDGGLQRSVFERSFIRSQRIKDIMEVLRELIPSRARIALIGYSEGAYLAPEIAYKDRRVQSLITIAGGTRGWLDEEINLCDQSELGRVLSKILDIYSQKTPTARWRGFAHRTWHSYDRDTPKEWLSKLRIPILTLHGLRDELVDVRSALADLESLRRSQGLRIETKVFRNLGHDMDLESVAVSRAVRSFLKDHFFTIRPQAKSSRFTRFQSQLPRTESAFF